MALGAFAIGTAAIGTLGTRTVASSAILGDSSQNVTMAYATDAAVNFDSNAVTATAVQMAFATDSEILIGGSAVTTILPTSWTTDQGVTGVWSSDTPIKGT